MGDEQRMWQKASRCASSNCAEVAFSEGEVWVRNSRVPDQPPLRFSMEEWMAFGDAIRAGEFDGPE